MTDNKIYGMHIKGENSCLSNNNPHICIGMGKLGDLTKCENLEEIKSIYNESNPDDARKTVSTKAGWLAKFIFDIQIGDYIVFGEKKTIHIGRVTSDAYYDPNIKDQSKDFSHNRKVEWLGHFNSSIFSDSFINSLGALHPIFNMDAHGDEIDEILNGSYLENLNFYEYMKNCNEIDSCKYTGSFEFINKICDVYKDVDLHILDSKDLELFYFSIVGTWASSYENKRKRIQDTHISQEKKDELITFLNEIEKKENDNYYSNYEIHDKKVMGLFGTGFGTFDKIDDEVAQSLIKMFVSMNNINDDEEAFDLYTKMITSEIKGIKTGVISPILFSIKPYIFPIINGNENHGTLIFDKLGIIIDDSKKLLTYIDNVKNIREFRDKHFKWKNYRIFDLASKLINDNADPETNETEEKDIGVTINETDIPLAECKTYKKEDFLKEVFIDESKYDEICNVLRRKRNIILQGTPGVGKTYMAKRLAYSLMGKKDDNHIEMVQFHQSYSYEDFIYGYHPTKNSFELQPGIFYSFCEKAKKDANSDYFFIIDEINRGNLSKIFGELLMLIENDKRDQSILLSHTQKDFFVPHNIHIIGMMNTADRSLAIVDYALRRRFSIITLSPSFNNILFKDELLKNGCNIELADKIINKFLSLNEFIAKDSTLGKGFMIGHSYFCNIKNLDEITYKEIVEYDIKPILKEYWFDNDSIAERKVEELLDIK